MNEKPEKPEAVLEFHGKYRRYILSGIKRYSIRLGRRNFAKELNICGFRGTLNSQTYYERLIDVPFEIFQKEDWISFSDALKELRNLYPDITAMSFVTVVEFVINIPPREVERNSCAVVQKP